MEKRFFAWIGFGFAVVALLAICWSILHLISAEFTAEKKGDLATWVGAIGTVGTFIGTIYLATEQERRRREELRTRGLVAIPGIAGYLHNVQASFELVCDELVTWLVFGERNKEGWDDTAEGCASHFFLITDMPESRIQDFGFIDPGVASDISNIDTRLQRFRKQVDLLKQLSLENVESRIGNLIEELRNEVAYIRAVLDQIDMHWNNREFKPN